MEETELQWQSKNPCHVGVGTTVKESVFMLKIAMGGYHQTTNLPFPSLTQIYGLMWAIHLPQVSEDMKKKEMKMKKQMFVESRKYQTAA